MYTITILVLKNFQEKVAENYKNKRRQIVLSYSSNFIFFGILYFNTGKTDYELFLIREYILWSYFFSWILFFFIKLFTRKYSVLIYFLLFFLTNIIYLLILLKYL